MGRNDVAVFEAWRLAVEKYFREWGIDNVVVQARLAVVTFKDNAERWWIAHLQEQPDAVLSFPQLLELMKIELIPGALTSASHLMWSDLTYRGNLEEYLQEVERMFHLHPIDPPTAHIFACKPLGRSLVNKVAAMDYEKGDTGIPLPQLLFQIRCFVEQRAGEWKSRNPRLAEGGRPVARVAQTELAQTNGGEPEAPRTTMGAVCWICGEADHRWPRCRRKKQRGCALCGSGAHQIRQCAQRKGWRPTTTQWGSSQSGGDKALPVEMAARVSWAEQQEAKEGWGADEGGSKWGENAEEVGVSAWMAMPLTSRDTGNHEGTEEAAEEGEFSGIHAFRAAIESVSGPKLEVVPETQGVKPLLDPGRVGKLEYPIIISGFETQALLDHGASASFLSEKLQERLRVAL